MMRRMDGTRSANRPNVIHARELNTAQMIAGTAPYRNAMVRKFIRLPTPAHDATMEQASKIVGFALNYALIF